ncbi:MAG TPA: cysteine desulfurase NifS [Tissierellaceae bacterium]|nr:cysteine desulfurase NifS [Tissierellaceae bacterium]
MSRKVYLDNAATTKIKKEVLEEMLPFFTENYGNPSSIYSLGSTSKVAIEKSRDQIAKVIGADTREIFFTGSGSESDNWAIKGVAYSNKKKGNHIITSKIEHHAVLHTCESLEKEGFEVTYLDVDENGTVDLQQLKDSIRDTTILITIMYANNEIGTIQPIEEIGKIAKENDIVFHTDSIQVIGNTSINVDELNIDLLSISAHKFHGPKGVGALYIRRGVRIDNFISGGAQERNRRAGTENVPGIVGMGKAIELAYENLEEHRNKMIELRDYAIEKIESSIDHVKLNGHRTNRLVNNANISFEYIEGESLLLSLDMKGIAASSGSACTSGSLDPSHVLMAIGLTHEIAHGSLRLSFSDFNTKEDVDYLVENLIVIVERLRKMSPLYNKI